MNFYKNIKSDARLILKNNWLKAVLVTGIGLLVFYVGLVTEGLVYNFIGVDYIQITDLINSFALSSTKIDTSMSGSLGMFLLISTVIYLIYYGFLSVLKMGYVYWNYLTVFNKDDNGFLSIFNYFSSFKGIFKSLYVSLQIFIRKFFWCQIIFLPAELVGMWSLFATVNQNQIMSKYLIPFGYILTLCLLIAGLITCLIFFQRYALTRYLIVLQQDSEEQLTVRKAIKLSKKIMKNHKTDYLLFVISFAFWFVLSSLVLPLFFILPYQSLSLTLYSRYLVEKYHQEKCGQSVQTEMDLQDQSFN